MAHRARKRFGQNFLHDPFIIDQIINAIHAQSDDHLVEIGPGMGALTESLIASGAQLDLIELDRDLITGLKVITANHPQVVIHNADALKFDFTSLCTNDTKLRVVGNLPYNISTPLIFHLLDAASAIQDMHFMLQKEVVDRLAAGPGSKHYGRLGIMVQYRCGVEKLIDVPPESFDPAPKVDSAVVRLTPYTDLPLYAKDEQKFKRLVTQAFNQRRKTLRNNLKGLLDEQQIQALGIDPTARAETLTLAQFVALSDLL